MSTDPHEPTCAAGNRSDVTFTASTLRSRLASLEQQIASLESQVALLHSAREQVLQDLAGVVYPVLEIPTEITSEIFLHCVLSHEYHVGQNIAPLTLASVCRRWRAVALSTCRLWTQLNFGRQWTSSPHSNTGWNYCTPTGVANRLEYWVPRAAGIPIDLHIQLPPSPSPESDNILRIVGQHTSRWRNLELTSNGSITFPSDVEGPFSALRKILLRSYPSAGGFTTIPSLCACPQLREAYLEGVELTNWRHSLPWIQLTKLELWYHAVGECVDMLAHTPNLEILSFTTESDDLNYPPTASVRTPHTLHRLHTLHIGSESSPELMEYVIAPSLKHLRLNWLTMRCSGQLRRLIARSGCLLRTLALYVYYPDLAPMFDCMSIVPSLRELELTWLGASTDDYSSLFKFLFEYPSVLPVLESFSIDECQINIDLVPLVRMLTARMEGYELEGDDRQGFTDDEEWTIATPGPDFSPKLKSFSLAFSQEDKYEEGPDIKQHNTDVNLALDRLRGLRSRGLRVDIQSLFKWFSRNINSQMIQEIGS
ncbi:hypothetical protein C8R43DRAFT_1058314 [Mycena crocata]|nr:hypothetical protein C8R43DRAFT_1058314 [Mycena crocata]